MLASFMGEDDVNAGVEILEQGNIPAFNAPEAAVDCFMNMYSYSRNLRSEEHTSELQSHSDLVCRLLLEKKKTTKKKKK